MAKLGVGKIHDITRELIAKPELLEIHPFEIAKMYRVSRHTACDALARHKKFTNSKHTDYQEFLEEASQRIDTETNKQIERCKKVLEDQKRNKVFPVPPEVLLAKSFLSKLKDA